MADAKKKTNGAGGKVAPNGSAAEPQTTNTMTVLGEIIWLMSQSELHREWPLGSIQQWVYPAIMHNQCRLYRHEGKPRGFVSWAWLTKDIEERYVRDTTSLRPDDWTGGDRLWFVDFIAPFGDTVRMVKDLRSTIFINDVARMLRVRKGDDTMSIQYLHGKQALDKARDREQNPTVELVEA